MPTFPAYITATIAPRSRYIVGTPGAATLWILAEPPVLPVGINSGSNVGAVTVVHNYSEFSPVGISSASNVGTTAALPDEVLITSDRDGETIPTGSSYTWEIKPVVYPGSYTYHPNEVPVDTTSISRRRRIYVDYWQDDEVRFFNSARNPITWEATLENTVLFAGGGNPYGGLWSHMRQRFITADTMIHIRDYNATYQCFVQDGVLQLTPSILVTLTANSPIRYTVDGSDPTLSSPLYSAPFDVSDIGTTVVKAATVVGGVLGTIKSASYTIPAPVPAGTLPYQAW
jgi:hypothetical protein